MHSSPVTTCSPLTSLNFQSMAALYDQALQTQPLQAEEVTLNCFAETHTLSSEGQVVACAADSIGLQDTCCQGLERYIETVRQLFSPSQQVLTDVSKSWRLVKPIATKVLASNPKLQKYFQLAEGLILYHLLPDRALKTHVGALLMGCPAIPCKFTYYRKGDPEPPKDPAARYIRFALGSAAPSAAWFNAHPHVEVIENLPADAPAATDLTLPYLRSLSVFIDNEQPRVYQTLANVARLPGLDFLEVDFDMGNGGEEVAALNNCSAKTVSLTHLQKHGNVPCQSLSKHMPRLEALNFNLVIGVPIFRLGEVTARVGDINHLQSIHLEFPLAYVPNRLECSDTYPIKPFISSFGSKFTSCTMPCMEEEYEQIVLALLNQYATKLSSFRFSGYKKNMSVVCEEYMRCIGHFVQLEHFFVSQWVPIEDGGLAHLQSCQSLRSLLLMGTSSPSELQQLLPHLTRLEVLGLKNWPANAQQDLANCRNIRTFCLTELHSQAELDEILKQFPLLEQLYIGSYEGDKMALASQLVDRLKGFSWKDISLRSLGDEGSPGCHQLLINGYELKRLVDPSAICN
jgi:hypothetical protein